MTDTTKTPDAAPAPIVTLSFSARVPETFELTGADPIFTESDDEEFRKAYANNPFVLTVKPLKKKDLVRLHKKCTKTKFSKGAQSSETDYLRLTAEMFLECVVAWKGIGGDGRVWPCDAQHKWMIIDDFLSFADAVANEAVRRGDAKAKNEAAEVERFR